MASGNNMQLRWEGLEDLRKALKQLPEDLSREAEHAVRAHAEAAKQRVLDKYPTSPAPPQGVSLRDGVQLQYVIERYAATIFLKSRAKHAHLFEYGTVRRKTAQGWDRGTMPPANVFRPITNEEQQALQRELIEICRRAGLEVRINETL